MKILFIRPAERFSGAEKYNVVLLRELRKYLDVTLLTNLEMLKNQPYTVRMETWLPKEVGTKKQLLAVLFQSPLFLARYLRIAAAYEVIVLQSLTEMIFLTPILKLLRRKTVWIVHGPLFASESAGLVKFFFLIASGFVDRIIAVSADTKRDLTRGGAPDKKIIVIYIGVDRKPVKKTPHKEFTIGFLGSVTKEKGIEEFAAVAKKTKTAAVVIGDGPYLKLLPAGIKRTGFVTNVDRHLCAVDVLLFPTRHHEGISMAILEAQAIGIPVLATDIGGNKEIIRDGYNGFLYRQGDTIGMARDIRMLSRNKTKTIKMGNNARLMIAARFSIGEQAKKFADFFSAL